MGVFVVLFDTDNIKRKYKQKKEKAYSTQKLVIQECYILHCVLVLNILDM